MRRYENKVKQKKVAVKMEKDESRRAPNQRQEQRLGGKGCKPGGGKDRSWRGRGRNWRDFWSVLCHTWFQNLTLNRQLLGLNIPLLFSKQLQNPMEKNVLSHSSHILPLNVAFHNLNVILILFFQRNKKIPTVAALKDNQIWLLGKAQEECK